jgi:hypothetical protein
LRKISSRGMWSLYPRGWRTMGEEPIVDAEVVAEDVMVTPVQEASTQLVRRERRSEVLRPLDPGTLLQSFEEYQGLLQRLLTNDDWQGRPNQAGSFVKKKGWRKIATAFDLDVTVIPGMNRIERDEDGSPIRAEVWIRAIAPSGRTMDGDGYCSVTEPRFAEAKGRQKLENDLRATATTRAKNRAISDLIGMGDVSAEEVDATPSMVEHPPYGTAVGEQQLASTRKALGYLLDCEPDENPVGIVLNTIEAKADGYLPHFPLAMITLVAQTVKDRMTAREETATIGEDDPVYETAEEMREREDAERLIADAEAVQ